MDGEEARIHLLFFSGPRDKQPRDRVLCLGAGCPPGSVWKRVDVRDLCRAGLGDPRCIWSAAGCRWAREAADHGRQPEPGSRFLRPGRFRRELRLCAWRAITSWRPGHSARSLAAHHRRPPSAWRPGTPPAPWNAITGRASDSGGEEGRARAAGDGDLGRVPTGTSRAEPGLLPASRGVSSSGEKVARGREATPSGSGEREADA